MAVDVLANELFFRFMADEPGTPQVIAAPIYGTYFCASWLSRNWISSTLDNQTLDELVDCGETAGVVPIICLGWWDLNPFAWECRQLSSNDQCATYEHVLSANGRQVRQLIEDRPKVGTTLVCHPVRSIDDYWVFEENLKRLQGQSSRVFERMCEVVERVGDRGVVYLNVALPHLMFGYIDDPHLIYDLMDYPTEVRTAFEKCNQAAHELIAMGLRAGIRLFFGGTHGILGPNVLREHMLVYARGICEKLHANGAYYYLHECGKMKALFEAGIYQDLSPDILEGFDRSPVGDIDDLVWARRQMGPETVFKGNIRLEDLRDGSPERIWQLCEQTVASVAGHRHILGTSCSVLYGTPMEHVQVLGEYCRTRQGADAKMED